MEIDDGLLALAPYADPHVRVAALTEARRAGRSGAQAAAVAEAVWLSTALEAKAAGHIAPPTTGRIAAVHQALGGDSLREEVRWLEQVAAAHLRCPLAEQLVAHLARAQQATHTHGQPTRSSASPTTDPPVPSEVP